MKTVIIGLFILFVLLFAAFVFLGHISLKKSSESSSDEFSRRIERWDTLITQLLKIVFIALLIALWIWVVMSGIEVPDSLC